LKCRNSISTLNYNRGKEKDSVLYYLITRYTGKSILFVNSIDFIRRLVPILSNLHPHLYPLHVEMQQKQRIKNLERFSAQDNALLIASDVAARGLDVPNVDMVIHYQIPRQADTYIHRSGRTGRAGTEGVSILLVLPSDAAQIGTLMKKLGKEICEFGIDGRLMPMLNKRLNLARRIDALSHADKKRKRSREWFKKAAAEIDVEYSGSESESEGNDREIKRLKGELKQMLSVPIVPRGENVKFITRSGLVDVALGARGSGMPTLAKRKAKDDFKNE
jgi:ATP-dependent RNA helicase DDX24/MAK5